jgi:hypothetical protein
MSSRTVINTSGIDYEKAMMEERFIPLGAYINAEGIEVIAYHETYKKGAGSHYLDLAGAMNCAKMEDKRQSNIARLRAKLAARKKAIQ